jgi:hypothetical protein
MRYGGGGKATIQNKLMSAQEEINDTNWFIIFNLWSFKMLHAYI